MAVLRADFERSFAKMENVVDAFANNDVVTLGEMIKRSDVVTPKGSIRNLGGMIVEYLRVHPLQTTNEIAAALFDSRYGLSPDAFLRRCNVTTSRLYRMLALIGKATDADTNQVRWFWIQQKGEGRPVERPSE